jgi:hypothetical protein
VAAFSTFNHLIGRYGLGADLKYIEAWCQQDGYCNICTKPLQFTNGRTTHYDHDHTTKAFRGLLCSCCNQMLGNAKDNPEFLRRGLNYLESFQLNFN